MKCVKINVINDAYNAYDAKHDVSCVMNMKDKGDKEGMEHRIKFITDKINNRILSPEILKGLIRERTKLRVQLANTLWQNIISESCSDRKIRISFHNDVKSHDGSSENVKAFNNVIMMFIDGKISSAFDVCKITKNNIDMVDMLIDETFILKCRMEEANEYKKMHDELDRIMGVITDSSMRKDIVNSLLKGEKIPSYPINQLVKKLYEEQDYEIYCEFLDRLIPVYKSDDEEFDEEWDAPQYIIRANKMLEKSAKVSVVRKGSRDQPCLINAKFVDKIGKCLTLFSEARNILQTIN